MPTSSHIIPHHPTSSHIIPHRYPCAWMVKSVFALRTLRYCLIKLWPSSRSRNVPFTWHSPSNCSFWNLSHPSSINWNEAKLETNAFRRWTKWRRETISCKLFCGSVVSSEGQGMVKRFGVCPLCRKSPATSQNATHFDANKASLKWKFRKKLHIMTFRLTIQQI